jgi:hypothetical protein
MKLQALASVAVIAAIAGAAHAADATAVQPAAEAAPADSLQSLRVVRDKETGRLRSATADEAKAMADAERAARGSQAAKPVVVRQYANGMKAAVLPLEFRSSLNAQRQPDGSLKITHADAADEHAGAGKQQHPTE